MVREFDDIDEDVRREAVDERRATAKALRCQCGHDEPGSCKGPSACPYSHWQADETDDEQEED